MKKLIFFYENPLFCKSNSGIIACIVWYCFSFVFMPTYIPITVLLDDENLFISKYSNSFKSFPDDKNRKTNEG